MSRVVLVTGAARGIGTSIVDALAADGWTAVVADFAIPDGGVSEVDGRPSIHLDVTDEASVDRAVEGVVDALGGLHAVVNNAGITRDRMLHKMSVEEWRDVMSVNLEGPFLVTRAFVRHIRAVEPAHARVVNISSISGKLGNLGQANYSSSKAGVLALTKVTAREIARYGATANAVMPGIIDTDMTRAMRPDVLAERIEGVPLRRSGSTDEVAEAVRWLCSEGAGYLTGGVLEVTGGRGM